MHCSNGEIILYVCLPMTYTTYLHNAPLQHIPLQDALQKWWNNCVCMCSHDIHFLLSYRFVAKHKHFELHCTKGETILYIYIYVHPWHTLPTGIPLCCNTHHFQMHCTNGEIMLYARLAMTYTTYLPTALLQHIFYVRMCTCIYVCICTTTQSCKHSSTQSCKYASMQAFTHASTNAHNHAR